MLHSMLFLLFAFVPLADVVTTPSNDKDLPDVQTHLPYQSLRNNPAVPIRDVRSSQLFGGSDEANKRSVGAVNKGLVLRRDKWAAGLWPRGEVPYEVSSHYTSQELSKIKWAMNAFHKHTCIRFRPRTPSDMYYLSIIKSGEGPPCWSKVGRQTTRDSRTPEGKFKTLTKLAPDCFSRLKITLHELMHALGFYHEHHRDDRNPLIDATVNLNPYWDYWSRAKYPRSYAYYLGNYDEKSIMHYDFPFEKFTRHYFSQSDISNINKLYNCKV